MANCQTDGCLYGREGACIMCGCTRPEALKPEPVLTRAEVALHEQYVVDHAGDHDDDCPGDDTCDCRFKARNDAVNAVCRYLAALFPEGGQG